LQAGGFAAQYTALKPQWAHRPHDQLNKTATKARYSSMRAYAVLESAISVLNMDGSRYYPVVGY